MLNKFLSAALATSLIALAGCDEDSASSGPGFGFEAPTRTPMSDSEITVDGKTYILKRNRLNYPRSGRVGEGWAIIADGQTVSCPSADEAGCRAALERHKRKPDEDDGGMY